MKPRGRASIATTRWSVRDLAGRLLEDQAHGGEQWDTLVVPMLCADPASDPLHRRAGERLWPTWFTAEMVDQAMRDPLSWQALYQQQPLDAAGGFIQLDWLHVVDDPPKKPRYYMGVDLALTSAGDYSAIVIAAADKATGCLYVVDAWHARVPAGEALDVLVGRCAHYEPLEVVIDDDNAWKLIRGSIGRTFRDAGVSALYFAALPLHGGVRGARGEGKQIRAAALQAACSRGEVRVLRRPWTADLVDELVRFPGGAHDDWLDCLSLLARRLALFANSEERADLVEYCLGNTGCTVTLPRLGPTGFREHRGIDRRPEESDSEYFRRKQTETLDQMLRSSPRLSRPRERASVCSVRAD